eukprot:COSAG01_NODE_1206_length_11242_cov_29.405905_8_plen_188_part_00
MSARVRKRCRCSGAPGLALPARPFPSSIFRDKNRRDIGKSQPTWTDPKMETAGAPAAMCSADCPYTPSRASTAAPISKIRACGFRVQCVSDPRDRTQPPHRQKRREIPVHMRHARWDNQGGDCDRNPPLLPRPHSPPPRAGACAAAVPPPSACWQHRPARPRPPPPPPGPCSPPAAAVLILSRRGRS